MGAERGRNSVEMESGNNDSSNGNFRRHGDLTARLLLPAVAQLVESNALPSDIKILGSAVDQWSPEKFRTHIAEALDMHAAQVSRTTRQTVVDMLDYRQSDVTDPTDVAGVIGTGHGSTLIYLALPSGLLEVALQRWPWPI